jgi:hypothetical protein
VDWDAVDSIGTSFSKNPAFQEKYPSTPSASAKATIIKRRGRTTAEPGLVPDNGGISRMADDSDRRGAFNAVSLTRTKLASQEEQATCFQLIEDGCESISFRLVQRGHTMVMMNENSSPQSASFATRASRLFARARESFNHSAKYQERNSAQPAQNVEPDRKEIKRLNAVAYLGGKRVIVTDSWVRAGPWGVR